MRLTRALRSFAVGLTLVAPSMLLAGCGGATSEVDNAELIKDSPKTAPAPAEAPPAQAAPDAPKG